MPRLPKEWYDAEDNDVKYIVWQIETCPDTGKHHAQGYLHLAKQQRLSYMKRLHATTHWEVRRGNHESARHYCLKPVDGCDCHHCKDCMPNVGGPWEHGEPPRHGGSNKLADLQELLDKKTPMNVVAKDHFELFVRHSRGLNAYAKIVGRACRDENVQPINIVLWGKTGTGKSWLANNMFIARDNIYPFLMPGKGQSPFADGYNGEECILFDEFYGWLPYNLVLRITDRYRLILQTKGDSVECLSRMNIFTSNKPPSEWYPNVEDQSALNRRFSPPYGFVIEMNAPFVPPDPVPPLFEEGRYAEQVSALLNRQPRDAQAPASVRIGAPEGNLELLAVAGEHAGPAFSNVRPGVNVNSQAHPDPPGPAPGDLDFVGGERGDVDAEENVSARFHRLRRERAVRANEQRLAEFLELADELSPTDSPNFAVNSVSGSKRGPTPDEQTQ